MYFEYFDLMNISFYTVFNEITGCERDCRFRKDTGRLPETYEVVSGKQIGRWLAKQRSEASTGDLSETRVEQIEEALGVDALVPLVDFERTLAEVVQHKLIHSSLPGRNADDEYVDRLSQWLHTRRRGYNDGSLSAAHSSRLDSELGLEWRPAFKSNMVRLTTTSQPPHNLRLMVHCVQSFCFQNRTFIYSGHFDPVNSCFNHILLILNSHYALNYKQLIDQ